MHSDERRFGHGQVALRLYAQECAVELPPPTGQDLVHPQDRALGYFELGRVQGKRPCLRLPIPP